MLARTPRRGQWRVGPIPPLEIVGREAGAHMLARTPRAPNYTRVSLQ